jgi:hypothetical protein
MEFIETPNAGIVWALSVASRTYSGTWALQRASFTLAIIRTFVTEFRAKYFLAVSLKTVETKFCGVFWHTFIFKAAFYHRFCNNRCSIIDNPCDIVLEITAALSSILNKYPLALT